MAETPALQRSSEVAATATGEQELIVRCLLIPFHGFNVLMPNTAIAEVVTYEAPKDIDEGPTWLKGIFSWRGVAVPVIGYERLLGLAEGSIASQARLVIFNSLADGGRVPFLAMVAAGIPRLLALKESNLHHAPATADDETGVYARLLLDGNPVVVPDLEVMEKMLLQVGFSERK